MTNLATVPLTERDKVILGVEGSWRAASHPETEGVRP